MSLKERFLNTFTGEKVDKTAFSPRIYYWYVVNKVFKRYNPKDKSTIPKEYYRKSQLEIHEMLNTCPRYCEETIYLNLLQKEYDPDANIEIKLARGQKRDESIKKYVTPLGTLTEVSSIGGGLGEHLTEYPIKTLDDIKIMKYIMENTITRFSRENLKKAEELFGNQGVVSTYIWRSPYQKLILDQMGFSRTILFLKRHYQETVNYMNFLESWDDKMYEFIADSSLKIINFGENIDSNLSSPPYFKKYLVPYYWKRVEQLQKAKKYCHIHIDGSFKTILPFLSELPFDGYEALTPEPQGDVKLEEIKKAIADKVYLDGIPSILFLPQYSWDYVEKYTRKILDMFSPRLILGISDELPPNGEIKKVELISKLVENYKHD